ncbi:MAG: stage III sporulation protein AG [Hungatella hathewayi]|nr:stage III sporulation protein AG [Hungatella hathewayi]
MDFKQWTSKFNWKNGKDKWLILLAVGLILLILAFPSGDGNGGFLGGGMKNGSGKTSESLAKLAESPGDTAAEAAAQVSKTYEQQMEARVKEILSHVEGVGKVDVMIVLKSSEEKVLRVDTNSSVSTTQETDSSGGSRKVESQDISEDTILAGSGDSQAPFVEKELKPEVAGVVISAEGGGSQKVKAEISEAMEALFDIPSHKIKVLKRVE